MRCTIASHVAGAREAGYRFSVAAGGPHVVRLLDLGGISRMLASRQAGT